MDGRLVGKYYLFTLILGVKIPLLYGLFWVLGENSIPEDYARIAKILKGTTIAGIMTILSSGL